MRDIYKFYYSLIGSKIYFLFILILVLSFGEGIGLSLFLPIFDALLENNLINSLPQTPIYYFFNILNFFGVKKNINTLIYSLIILFFFKFLISVLISFYISRYVAKFSIDFRKQIYFQRIHTQPINATTLSKGFQLSIFSEQTERVVNSFIYFLQFVSKSIQVFLYLIIAVLISPYLTILFIFIGSIILFLFKKINRITHRMSVKNSTISTFFLEEWRQIVESFTYLFAINKLYYRKINLFKLLKEYQNNFFNLRLINSVIQQAQEPFSVIIFAIILYFVLNYNITSLSAVLVTLLMFYRTTSGLWAMQTYLQGVYDNIGGIKIYQDFNSQMKKNKLKNDFQNNDIVLNESNNAMKFQNVSFSYRPEKNVLKNISFEISENCILLIVGHSGSGKSTLFNLMLGLLDPTEGAISRKNVFGLNEDKNHIVGYVPQNPIFYNDSIIKNIILDEPYDIIKLNEVINLAGLASSLNELKDLYGTDMLKGISGGQLQRIALARELYRNPKFLFLDEFSSAVDFETKKIIYKSVEILKHKMTIFIISHDEDYFSISDYLLHIYEGEVKYFGPTNIYLNNHA